jgi:hypothetical protein
MPENTSRVARLISDSIEGKLSEPRKSELEDWTSSAEENKSLASILSIETERNARISRFNMADADAIWNNLRARGRSESGFQLEGRPVAQVPVSLALKSFLIAMAVLAVLSVVAVFYMTVSNVKNNRYPVKSIQRSFRF